jgi:Domain of unknown function (DUF4177)
MLRATSWIWSSLILAGWLIAAPSALAQKKDPNSDPPRKVDDEAALFSKEAVLAANQEIAAIKSAYHKDLLIQTREKGKEDRTEFRQWAEEQAKEHRVEGIYILITTEPKHFEIMVGKQTLKSGAFTIDDEKDLQKILKENLGKKPNDALRLVVEHVHAAFKNKVARAAVKWEYKVLTSPRIGDAIDTQKLEETLNKLGEDGWECAGTLSEVRGEGAVNRYVILKRPKQ